MAEHKFTDLTGKKFNNFTVLKLSTNQPNKSYKYWDCVCICGNTRSVRQSNLGKVKGCGCVRKEYELTGKYAGKKRVARKAKLVANPKPISNFVINSAKVSEAKKVAEDQIKAGITRRSIEDIRERLEMESYFSL